MKIGYSKWRMNLNLVMGILWTFIGVFRVYELFFTDDFVWFYILFIILGPLYLFIYFYDKEYGYFVIDDEKVEVQGIPKKSIHFKNLRAMRYFAGDYIFKDHFGKEIFLRKEAIDKKMIPVFEEKFGELKEKFDQNLFSENLNIITQS